MKIVPFAFGLMSNRKKITYQSVFRYIDEHLGIANGLKCKLFMADYEIAISSAFVAVVPSAKVTHCLFHFCQAVKLNAKKCGAMQNFFDM